MKLASQPIKLQKKGHKAAKKKKKQKKTKTKTKNKKQKTKQKDVVKHKKLLTVPINTTHLA